MNTFPGSPTADRFVVMFNVFGDGSDQLHSTFSDDQGTTWSPAQAVGPTQGVFCQPLFLPDGSLGVIYFHYLNNIFGTSADAQIEFMHSPDGGQTFAPPVLIAPMTGMIYHDLVARDAWDTPSACTDRQAGIIYVTYQARMGSAPDQVPRIMFTRSIDQGQTWSPPVAVNDTPDRHGVFNPCIAASPDGQHVTIAFYDKRHQTTNSAENLVDYYLAESFDGGDTWETNLRLSDVSTDLRLAPATSIGRMLADYQGIVPALNFDVPGVAVWIDTRTGSPDPFVVRIYRTRGTTFETWRKLRFNATDLANPALSGESADPDGDRIPNLAEYAFGLEPNHPDASPVALGYDPRHYGWNVSHPQLAVMSDIEFSWEVSSNLTDWAPYDPDPVGEAGTVNVAQNPALQRHVTSIDRNASLAFFRLKVWRTWLP